MTAQKRRTLGGWMWFAAMIGGWALFFGLLLFSEATLSDLWHELRGWPLDCRARVARLRQSA
jgi:hypothetical protein